MAFLFSINYPKCKVLNSISVQVLLTTSYPVQYLGLADPFKRNELEQYYMQTYFHHLVLIWIEMVYISC